MIKQAQEYIDVDAVITWVDGNEEAHRVKMKEYLPTDKHILDRGIRTRYDQVDEIKYVVNSILKFAPFVRNIYIVTDNQTPKFLKEVDKTQKYEKVVIVDHKIIFRGFEKYLPTFNSRAIETCLHRIPNLSEHFIYLNDDVFIIGPTQIGDFFRNKKPVLRGKWLNFPEHSILYKFKRKRIGHKTAKQMSAKMVSLNRYYNFRHTPHPMRKSILLNYYAENPQDFITNIKFKFRNKNQHLIQGLSNHIEIKNGNCYLEDDLSLVYFRSFKKPLFWYRFYFKLYTRNKLFMGLQSLDNCPPRILAFLLNWLTEKTRL